MTAIKLFVGLGNPGEKYTGTRHNTGFWWVDLVAEQSRSQLKVNAKSLGEAWKINIYLYHRKTTYKSRYRSL